MALAQRLRHAVTFQSQVQTQDLANGGAVNVAWADAFVDVPAEVVPLSGREFLQANAQQVAVSARVTVAWLDGLDETMRMVFDGENYDIQAVLPDPSARRWLTLMVSKGPSDGE